MSLLYSIVILSLEEVNKREILNTIASLKPMQKSIELKVIVLSKDVPKELKKGDVLH